MTDRARVIIVRDGAVALIARRRAGQQYCVFPGGGVEPGETPEAAAAREALEELGLRVVVGRCVAVLAKEDERQYFFLASVAGGELGTGRGAEVAGRAPASGGDYRPCWCPAARFPTLTVYPVAVQSLVASVLCGGQGWPATRVFLSA